MHFSSTINRRVEPCENVRFERGQVLEVRIPFEDDETQSKGRPCIVLKDDEELFCLVLCPATTKMHKKIYEPEPVIIIHEDSTTAAEMKLKEDSLLQVSKILKMNKYDIGRDYRLLGKAPEEIMNQISKASSAI